MVQSIFQGEIPWCLLLSLIQSIGVFNNSLHWNLSDSKSPQVSGTFLSFLADFTNILDSYADLPFLQYFSQAFWNHFKFADSI